jgi:hypothetical protein
MASKFGQISAKIGGQKGERPKRAAKKTGLGEKRQKISTIENEIGIIGESIENSTNIEPIELKLKIVDFSLRMSPVLTNERIQKVINQVNSQNSILESEHIAETRRIFRNKTWQKWMQTNWNKYSDNRTWLGHTVRHCFNLSKSKLKISRIPIADQ